jgi:hypothetical protein
LCKGKETFQRKMARKEKARIGKSEGEEMNTIGIHLFY